MPSPGRRAIDLLRRRAHEVRRLRARADAIQHARRSLSPAGTEGGPTAREDAERHIADGTIVMGRESRFTPVVHKFKGDTGRVFVGNFVSIARGVELYCGGMHRTEWVSQYGLRAMLDLPGAYEDGFPHGRGDIHVGHDASLAEGSVVTSGVTIGPGAVVTTRAVVTRNVAPYAIVGGIPAKQVGQRFDDEQVRALLRIAWWDWPLDAIKERVGLLSSPGIDAFIARYDRASQGSQDGS